MRWAPVALAALVLSACSPSAGQVEGALERQLPRLFGPADDYDVEIEGLRARDGEADVVTAAGRRVRPEGLPVLDRIDAVFRGVRYDRSAQRLERVDSVTARVAILASDLATFLESHDKVRSATVELEAPDRAMVRMRPSLGGFTLPPGVTVEVTGRVEAEGSDIRFVVEEAAAGGFHLGGEAAERLSDLINPLVDLAELPIDLRATGVRVEGSVLYVEMAGSATAVEL